MESLFSTLEELQNYINSLDKRRGGIIFSTKRGDKRKTCHAKIYEIDGVQKIGISIINKFVYEEHP